ncbi:hypothetical protein SEPCBS57363_000525 [Sporothrix epigloea]|uniref:Uncharacterized protein n=1 Tax=Sporothrix epigloea TaxID=1892477 RepID=A0ABP0D7Y0_9PEZI
MDSDHAGAATSHQKTSTTDSTATSTSDVKRRSSNGSGNGNSAAFDKNHPLAKSDSVVSHKSIPFTGTFPIGQLKIHQASVKESMIYDDYNGAGAANAAIASGRFGQNRPSRHPPIKGDTFVLLSTPEEAHVGCDSTALTVKKIANAEESFLGFRDLPPGAHLVWLSAPGAMSRQGYWFVTRPASTSASVPRAGIVRVKQWDQYNEVLGECASQYEAQSLAADLTSIYPRLLAYNSKPCTETGDTNTSLGSSYLGPPLRNGELSIPEAGLWTSLVSCISEELLARVMGERLLSAGNRTMAESSVATATAAETRCTEWLVSTNDTVQGEMAMPLRPASTQLWGNSGGAEFTFIFAKDDLDPYQLLASRDRRRPSSSGGTVSSSVAPSTITTDSSDHDHDYDHDSVVDTTERIAAMLEQQASRGLCDNDLIGELQFAFLTGTLLSNLSCLEQWWHLVLKVYLRAYKLVTRRPVLCRMFFQTLHCQFLFLERHVAGGFLGHSSSPGNDDKAAGITPRGGSSDVASTATVTAEADAGGTGLFDAKTQGAMQLQTSLTVFKRRLNEMLLDLGKAASTHEAAVGEAFASLEASLWKYGWDLRSDYVSRGSGNNSGDTDDIDSRVGHFGDLADNDDSDDEMDYYEEAIKRTTDSRKDGQRHHTGLSDTDSESDQPVLVELDEDGREVGLVSWD